MTCWSYFGFVVWPGSDRPLIRSLICWARSSFYSSGTDWLELPNPAVSWYKFTDLETYWSVYRKHTGSHMGTNTHTRSATVLADLVGTDGKTAESREEVEIKVTVSGWTIGAQGQAIHAVKVFHLNINQWHSFPIYNSSLITVWTNKNTVCFSNTKMCHHCSDSTCRFIPLQLIYWNA